MGLNVVNPTGFLDLTPDDDSVAYTQAPLPGSLNYVEGEGGTDRLTINIPIQSGFEYTILDGNNTFNVFASNFYPSLNITAFNFENLTLVGSSAHDHFLLRIGASTAGLAVNLDGADGQDTLTFDAGRSTSSLTFSVADDGTIASSFGSFANFEGFELISGSGDDHIATASGNDNIQTGTGLDFVDAGAGDDSIYTIGGGDTVAGGAGRDSWTGNMSSETSGITVNISSTITISNGTTATGIESVSVGGGQGDDAYFIDRPVNGAVDGGLGYDTLSVSIAHDPLNFVVNAYSQDTIGGSIGELGFSGFERVGLAGGDGNDTFVLNGPFLNGAVTIDGGAGVDSVRVDFSRYADPTMFAVDVSGVVTTNHGQFAHIENYSLFSGAGNDTMSTGAGADLLNGGGGNDTLDGGGGQDVLLGEDGQDHLLGGDGNDYLYGGDGQDYLFGGNGDDTLCGDDFQAAADTLEGGSGDDNYIRVDALDTIIEATNGGFDTVQTAVDYVLPVNVEGLTLYGYANLGYGQPLPVSGTGNGSDNIIIGNEGQNSLFGLGGNDTLQGGGGDDVLVGGAGNDILDGGGGNDTAVYSDASAGVTVDLSLTGAQNTGGSGTDTLISVENLIGSAFADSLTGDAGANRLDGGDGNDALYGGLGDDRLAGGDGDDTLNGGADADTADYSAAISAVMVNLSVAGPQNTGGAGSDTLISIENLIGSAFADTLTGDAGANYLQGGGGNDALQGGAGDDLLEGGLGNDSFTGGDGFDTVTYAGSSGAISIEWMGQVTGANGNDQISSDVERIVGSNFNDNLSTQAGGGMTLEGGAGKDTLVSYSGNNRLLGGSGDDLLFRGYLPLPSSAPDYYDGGPGNDTVSLAYSQSGVTIDLGISGTPQVTGGGGTVTLVSVENLIGSNDYADSITGSTVANVLQGGGGNDTLRGMGGNDTLLGGNGDDTLTGGSGSDMLTGGAGTDTFTDTAAGLSGDTITDFSAGEKIVVTDAVASSFTASLNGNVLTYTGGSLTLTSVPTGQISFKAAVGGGVELSFSTLSPLVISDVRSDFDGDGKDDILWRNDNGQFGGWLANGNGGFAYNAAGGAPIVSTDWHIVGGGDFNGDGRSDMLWRNDNGQFGNWLANPNGGFAYNAAAGVTMVSTDWHIVGTGDFNGDGRDDILWRNVDGTLGNWLANPNGGHSYNAAAGAVQVSTDWHIAGTGDYNGDGRTDILWRNDNGQFGNWLANTSGGFAYNAAAGITAVDNSWKIVGSGDFNGDGRTDILWRNDNGQFGDWLANTSGGFAYNAAAGVTAVDNSWHIIDTGDFNGDSRDDILWRNDDGRFGDWLGNVNGGFSYNAAAGVTAVTNDWHVQPQDSLFV